MSPGEESAESLADIDAARQAQSEQTPDAEAVGAGARMATPRITRLVGVAAGLCTFGFLLLGAGRSYDLDSGITVRGFVVPGSLFAPFRARYLLNNHVFFSFLDHIVYMVTGSSHEWVMRLLPIVFGAITVGLVAAWLAGRWGVAAAAAGAAVLATNPMFAFESSEVRGYSLVVLCTTITTGLLLRALRTEHMSLGVQLAYALVAAVGVATHLYMLVVLLVHLCVVLSKRTMLSRFVIPWLGACIGLAAYMFTQRYLRHVAALSGRRFRATFPRDLLVEVLGGSLVAVALLAPVVAFAAWSRRDDRRVRWAAGGLVLAVVTPWVVAPFDLYPRFFVWSMPIVAVLVAACVSRIRWSALLVAAVVVVQVVTVWPRLQEDPYATRVMARVVAKVEAAGGYSCVSDNATGLRTAAYDMPVIDAPIPRVVELCTVMFSLVGSARSARAAELDAAFRYRTTLPALEPTVMWSRLPARCWTTAEPLVGECDERQPGAAPRRPNQR